jgi:hypothetical protein
MTRETILTKWLSVSFINRTWRTKRKICFFFIVGRENELIRWVTILWDGCLRCLCHPSMEILSCTLATMGGEDFTIDFGRVYTPFSHAPRNRTAPVIWSLKRKKERWSSTKTWFWRVNWWAYIRFFCILGTQRVSFKWKVRLGEWKSREPIWEIGKPEPSSMITFSVPSHSEWIDRLARSPVNYFRSSQDFICFPFQFCLEEHFGWWNCNRKMILQYNISKIIV